MPHLAHTGQKIELWWNTNEDYNSPFCRKRINLTPSPNWIYAVKLHDRVKRWATTTYVRGLRRLPKVYSLECCSFTQKWSNQEFECCFGTHTRANNVMNDILLMVPHVICILRTLLRRYLAFCRCTMDAAKILEFENPFNGVHLEWFDHSKYIWLIIVIAYKCPCLKV